MTPSTEPNNHEALVQQILALTKENNQLLKAMRRDALIAGVLKMILWIVLIGASLYFSYQFLAPYLAMLEGAQSVESQDWGALFEEYRSLIGQ